MKFVRVPDTLPSPQEYLRAGVPRPLASVDQSPPARNATVSDLRQVPDLSDIHPNDTTVGDTFTVMDLSGTIAGVVWARSSQYLTRPTKMRAVWAEVMSTRRTSNGLLQIDRGSYVPGNYPVIRDPIELSAVRIVTVDTSVLLAGLDPAKFRHDDVIFLSAAVAMEVALTVSAPAGDEPQEPDTVHYASWDLSVPVPIDHYVLRMYTHLADALRPPITRNSQIDRTELICAATAILYEAPLYTAKPEAYQGIKNGLKLIPYGPVRNKSALDQYSAPDPFAEK